MSNVVPLPDRGVKAALGNALVTDLDSIIIIGFTRSGEFWSDATIKDGGDALWLLEEAKRRVMEAGP